MAETNSSLEKALVVLDLFLDDKRITAADAVKATGFSNASVLRILNTLEKAHYIYRDLIDGGYYLADKLFLLARNTNLKKQIVNVIDAPLTGLCRSCGFSVTASIREGNKSITALRKDPQNSFSLIPNVGTRLSLNCTASGKILCAFDEDYKGCIDSITFTRINNKTIVDKQEFADQIERIRSEKLAYDMEEITDGMICVAAPVLDPQGIVICSISISGYKERMIRDMDRSVIFLRKTTREIEKLMR